MSIREYNATTALGKQIVADIIKLLDTVDSRVYRTRLHYKYTHVLESKTQEQPDSTYSIGERILCNLHQLYNVDYDNREVYFRLANGAVNSPLRDILFGLKPEITFEDSESNQHSSIMTYRLVCDTHDFCIKYKRGDIRLKDSDWTWDNIVVIEVNIAS